MCALQIAIISCIAISSSSQQEVSHLEGTAHEFFQHELKREVYFDKFSLDPEEKVTFNPSLVSFPGLPQWMNYTQNNQTASGYLYGTPTTLDVGSLELEVFGENLDTFEASRVLLTIQINELSNENFPQHHLTLFIQNHNIEDVLLKNVQEQLISGLSQFWGQSSNIFLYDIKSASQLGLRNPIPSNNDNKDGVQVTLSSSHIPPTNFVSAYEEIELSCSNETNSPVPADFKEFQETFEILWCRTTFTTLTAVSTATTNRQPIDLGGEYDAPVLAMEQSSDFIGFLIIVAIPLLILFTIIVILCCLMFFNRQGIEKRNQETPEIQLAHHSMIRQASQELRNLSNRRDGGPTPVGSSTPQLAATPNLRGRRTPTRTVLPHQTPPPPYRLPPAARQTQETSFTTPRESRRLSEPTQSKG